MMKELDRERAIWSHCYIWVQSFLFPAPSSVSPWAPKYVQFTPQL